MRICVFDLETTMGLKGDYSIVVCGVVKPLDGKPKVFYKGRKGDNDKVLCQTIKEELERYDILIGHYSLKFDLPYLNARLLYWNLPKVGARLHIDTYILAKRGLQISSRRLKGIVAHLKLGQKIGVEPEEWRKAAYGDDPKAIRKIVDHCVRDVELTEKVYWRLKGFLKGISMAY